MKKVIIISGGSSGLGNEIAKKLSPKNRVIILSRNKNTLEKIAKNISCDFRVCDIFDYSGIQETVRYIVKKYKRIDCLINCAGQWIQGPIEKNSPPEIKRVIDTNTTGTIFLTRAVVPQMKKQKKGRIIMINSGAGLYHKAERSIYTASKWAITGFTKALQDELHEYGITVSGIYPGKMTPAVKNKGKKKHTWPALKISELAEIIAFIVAFKPNIEFSEFEVKHLKT